MVTTHIKDVLKPEDIQRFKDQLMIVLVKRLVDSNGKLNIPMEEMDDTGQNLLSFEVTQIPKGISFTLRKKQ